MNTPDALLRAVLHAPADDAPRLQLADCLDDSGEGDRAAFIRCQVELARWKEGELSRKAIKRHAALRRRERELIENWTNADAWFCAEHFKLNNVEVGPKLKVTPADLPENAPNGMSFNLRRGFIESVTCPTALFIGGVCERCRGDGRAHGSDRHFEWSADVDYGKCVVCRGSGRTVGISGPLFAREPVVSVTLSDREPAGHSKTWWWFFPASVGLAANAGNHLPDILIPFFDKGCFGGHIYYDSRDLALAALSSAAVAYGRSLATGCTHEVVCETCERTGKVKPYSVSYRTSVKKGSRWGTDLCPECDGTGRVVRAGLPPLVNHKATSEAP